MSLSLAFFLVLSLVLGAAALALRLRLHSVEVANRLALADLERTESDLRSELRGEQRANEALLEQNLALLTQIEESTTERDHWKREYRVAEDRRADVGSVIGRVIHEKKVWVELYQGLRVTAANAQSMMWSEIARLSKLAGKPVAADVQQAADLAKRAMTATLPKTPTDEEYREQLAKANAPAVSPETPPEAS